MSRVARQRVAQSSGCIEDYLIDKVCDGTLASVRPEVVRYGVGTEAAHQFGLPCGGTIELVLEPVSVRSRLAELLGLLERGERVRRILTLASGEVQLQAGADFDELLLTDTALSTVHGPCWRMLLIGAGQMTRYLAEMAIALGYEVVVCDPREEYATGFAIAHTQLVRSMPDDAVHDFQVDAHCAVVALTHDPKLDDLALMEALNSDAFYVGAIGSRANQTKRRARLAEHFGMTEQQLGRLHGPVGLKNGARTPPEIAVSILAEVTASRYGYRIAEPVRLQPEAATPGD